MVHARACKRVGHAPILRDGLLESTEPLKDLADPKRYDRDHRVIRRNTVDGLPKARNPLLSLSETGGFTVRRERIAGVLEQPEQTILVLGRTH